MKLVEDICPVCYCYRNEHDGGTYDECIEREQREIEAEIEAYEM